MSLTQTFKRATTNTGKFEVRKEYVIHDWISKRYEGSIPVERCEELAKSIIATVKKQKGCQKVNGTIRGANTLRDRIIFDRYNVRFGVKPEDFENIGLYGIYDVCDMLLCFETAVRLSLLAKAAKEAGEEYIIHEIA